MFSKQTAKRLNVILSEEAVKEINILLDELIDIDNKKLSAGSSDRELVAVVSRLELLRKLKDFKKYARDAVEREE